jgi:hypothetical protein
MLCVVAALLTALFLGDWALRSGEVSFPKEVTRIAEPPSILGPQAFAFLEPPPPVSGSGRDPFRAAADEEPTSRPTERPPRQDPPPKAPAPDAPTRSPAQPVRPDPPAPAVVPDPAVTVPPPAVAPRLGVCDVRYVFNSVNRSGRPVALIELRDPGRPGAAPVARNVSAGEAVFGLRVQSFTDEALVLVDAAGRRHSVAFGGSRRVSVEVSGRP